MWIENSGDESDWLHAHVRSLVACLVTFFVPVLMLLGSGIRAPYGRYSSNSFGGWRVPCINGRIELWGHSSSLIMIVFVMFYHSRSACTSSIANLYFVALFVAHYVNRGPLMALGVVSPKPIPVPLFLSSTCFLLLNGWIQGVSLLNIYTFGLETFFELRFFVGNALFFWGMYTNISSDLYLIALRKKNGPRIYSIPYGGMFELVSGANFLGECTEWLGFAVMCGTPASWMFFFASVCNLGPRALHHHQWYLNHFPNYPKNRRAFIPYVF